MMSSKKASLVTASSLLRLCNRCCSRHVANCIKGCNKSRAISTAAERWDFQANDSLAYQQNRPGFHQQNASGPYRNNHASSEQISYGSGQTAGGGHVNNNITQNVVQNNLAEHNGSVNGDFGQRNLKIQHKVGVGIDNSRGFGMHPIGSFERHNWTLESGEKLKYSNSHSLPRPIDYQGNRWNLTQNIAHFQQAPNLNTQSSAFGQSRQGPNLNTQNSAFRQSQQATNLNTQNSAFGQSHQTPNLNTQNSAYRQSQQAPNLNTQNSAFGQSHQTPNLNTQNSAYRQSQKAPNLNTQNSAFGQSHQAPNLNTQNSAYRQSQQAPNLNTQSSAFGQSHQTPNLNTQNSAFGQSQQAPNLNTQNSAYRKSYQVPNLNTQNSAYGQSHQAPNLNIQNSTYGQSQQKSMDVPPPNLNTAQKSTVGTPPYTGTLEELDTFCMEGKIKEAIAVLQLLEKLDIHVGLDRCLRLMQLCGKAKSLEEAKVVDKYASQHLSPLKVSTCNGILEMYFQCGSVDDAVNVFKNMTKHDLTTLYTMITQLAKNGFAEDSIDIFTKFKSLGLKPDGQMFIGVFGACSMLGDIAEGLLHFESMSRDYGIVPTMAHYVSLVDMIGSVGHLVEALEFIEKMPIEPSVEVWETLMNSCRVHGNTELGDRCAELVEKLDPSRLNEKSKAGLLLVETSYLEAKKKLASNNLLQVRSQKREYRAGDTLDPDNEEIYALLRGLRVQMKEVGYTAETKYCLHDIDHESKEDALLGHSERLAVACGLINSAPRNTIRVMKNLRVCVDCHTALKIISDLVGREFIIRDAKRFHHFKNGMCSCRDYW